MSTSNHVLLSGVSPFLRAEKGGWRAVLPMGQCFSVGQVCTAITAAVVTGTTSLVCMGASLGWNPDSPWAASIVARLLVPKLTSSRLSQKFQYNAAPHHNQILFSRWGWQLYVLQELFCTKAENKRRDGRNGTEKLHEWWIASSQPRRDWLVEGRFSHLRRDYWWECQQDRNVVKS